jgi:hypothetical protein
MKAVEGSVKGFLCLPITETTEKQLGDVSMLEASVINSGLVMMKSKMTAMDVIQTIEGLEAVIGELYDSLLEVSCYCDNDCDQSETLEAVNIKLPDFILEDAGISKNAKLCAYTNEDSKEVTVIETDYKHDLSDVPETMRRVLKDMGACMTCLNECLISEKIIW